MDPLALAGSGRVLPEQALARARAQAVRADGTEAPSAWHPERRAQFAACAFALGTYRYRVRMRQRAPRMPDAALLPSNGEVQLTTASRLGARRELEALAASLLAKCSVEEAVRLVRSVAKEALAEAPMEGLQNLSRAAEYSSLKVVNLKQILSERGLKMSGRKNELIQRLEEHDAEEKSKKSSSSDSCGADKVPERKKAASKMDQDGVPQGTTVVKSKEDADAALKILMQLRQPGVFHAIDTEVQGWSPGRTPYGHGEVICWSIYCGDQVDFGSGPRLFIDNLDEEGQLRGLVEYFKDYLEDPDIPKVFQNYSFDRAQFVNHGCRVAGFAGDTMHMARLEHSDAEKGYSLEALGKRFMGDAWGKRNLKEFMKQESVKRVEHLHLSQDPEIREAWVDYSTFDTVVTWKVHEELRRRLAKEKLNMPKQEGTLLDFYERFWRPFADVLVEIEERGIYVDREFLQGRYEVALKEQEEEEAAFMEFVRCQWERLYPDHPELQETLEPGARQFNANSPLQMKQLLYGTDVKEVAQVMVGGLGLKPVKVGKVMASTSTEALRKLAGPNPEAGEAGCGLAFEQLGQEGCIGLSHRVEVSAISKAISLFLVKLLEEDGMLDSRGRVHTSLNLMTSTGRLTSKSPNLQQVPAVDKDRFQIRGSIVAEKGKIFVIADYGQLDLRVLAHTSGCPAMINALSSGIDLHSHAAAQMYEHVQEAIDEGKVSMEGGDDRPCVKDVFASERRNAKAVNFGIAYGLTAKGLSRQLNCEEPEAQNMINMWNTAYSQVCEWQRKVCLDAECDGLFVKTYRGRRRHLENLAKRPPPVPFHLKKRRLQNKNNFFRHDDGYWEYISAKRQAINAPVQGGSADVVVEAMIKAHRDEELRQMGCEMVLQVHDELIFECPEEYADQALQAVTRIMEHPFLDDYEFAVPLVVDAKVARSWHDAKHA
ncbi:unnamed protein product [Effrenium voratum]|uniref:SAP domain-containing protein n=1 Tax=Effrenium voratum TaxID=2562239 RepID=A0AA36J433_9DINO|nr:unnamed protein product [Effrenium voratum]